jgi:hypothetical protein
LGFFPDIVAGFDSAPYAIFITFCTILGVFIERRSWECVFTREPCGSVHL